MKNNVVEFSNKVIMLANEIRKDDKERSFTCPICQGKSILKISGDLNQEIWAYCDVCKNRGEGVIYD
ncbi:hypothetical protein [uncultured Clostridium sp.]|uniref:hypothetical protein n=1 Tax=uncultured Clostridium sp. TaxID=59620 RepID=UPI0025FDBD05|nr:hypothetical protein [uncultured Clostridium sp.]